MKKLCALHFITINATITVIIRSASVIVDHDKKQQ
jgi:hypothetical protein